MTPPRAAKPFSCKSLSRSVLGAEPLCTSPPLRQFAPPKSRRLANARSLTCVNYYDGDAAILAAAPGLGRRERAGGHPAGTRATHRQPGSEAVSCGEPFHL